MGYARCGGEVCREPVATASTVQMTYGQRYSSPTLGNHGACALTRYKAGDDRSTDRARDGLSVSPARKGFARQTGFSVPLARKNCVHPWLLLASARGLRAGSVAQISPELLVAETRCESTARFEERKRAPGRGLGCADNLGMRAGRYRSAQNKNKGIS